MKKILLAAVLACACLQTVNAQEQRRANKEEMAEKMVQRMDRALDLNDQQEKDLLAVYKEMFSQRKAAKTGDKQERVNKRKEFADKVNAILTEEQQKKWADFKLKQAEKRKEAYKARKAKKENK